MVSTYTFGRFPEGECDSFFDSYCVEYTLDEENLSVSFWDTQGQEEYEGLRRQCCVEADIILVCFSIANPTSLANVISRWVPELKRNCPQIPFFLVGTKQDLRDDRETLSQLASKNLSPISFLQAEIVANTVKAKRYIECSALTQEGLERVFEEAVMEILGKEPKGKTHKKHKNCSIQ